MSTLDNCTTAPAVLLSRGRLAKTVVIALLLVTANLSNGQVGGYQGVDVYGTDAFDAAYVEREFKSELEQISQAVLAMDRVTEARLSTAIARELEQLGEFAYVGVHAIIPGGYISVDVVERADAGRRMPFRSAPEWTYEDPEGLLGQWREYFDKLVRLAQAGELQDSGACEVLHCLAPFAPNPQLLPYLRIFNEGVRKHEDLLYEIALGDVNGAHRASAVFLLGHSENLDRLLPLLRTAMYDRYWEVRNNAMRVRIWIAMAHPELPFPVEDFIAAMDFPTAADRNKTTFMLVGLAELPEYHAIILERAVPIALKILRLERPANHLGAYELLKAVSGEDFGARNYGAWEEWYRGQPLDVR